MKKLSIGLVAALAAISLTACSPTSGDNDAAAPGPDALADAEGVVEVTLWHGLGGGTGEALDARIESFNEEYEGEIAVTSVFQGSYAELLAKYTAGLRDSSGPTVILASDIASGFLNDAGQTLSPETAAAANPGTLDLTELRSAAADYYTVDGELVAVPMATSTPILWVNPTLLKDAGIAPDVKLETLEQVNEVAKQVTEATGVPGLVQPFDGWWFEQLTAASGNLYCTPENGRGAEGQATAVSLSSDSQVAAFGQIADIYTSGAGLDVGVDGLAAITAFTSGEVAMLFMSSGAAGIIGDSGVDFDARTFPTVGSAGDSGTVVGGSALWLSSTADDAETVAGWQLMSYLASAEQQELWSQATGYIPINTAVDESASHQAYLKENPSAQLFIDQVNSVPAVSATSGCMSGAMTAIREAVVGEMQAVFSGAATLEDGVAEAEKRANEAVQKYLDQLG